MVVNIILYGLYFVILLMILDNTITFELSKRIHSVDLQLILTPFLGVMILLIKYFNEQWDIYSIERLYIFSISALVVNGFYLIRLKTFYNRLTEILYIVFLVILLALVFIV